MITVDATENITMNEMTLSNVGNSGYTIYTKTSSGHVNINGCRGTGVYQIAATSEYSASEVKITNSTFSMSALSVPSYIMLTNSTSVVTVMNIDVQYIA